MSTPTANELRELDAWIAEHVMKWTRTDDPDKWTDTDETLFWYRSEQARLKKPVVVVGRAYKPYGQRRFDHVWTTFDPSTNPAAVMQVLEKCAVGSVVTHITKLGDNWIIWRGDDAAIRDRICAKTLPLAICLFAKQIFGSRTPSPASGG